MLMAKYGSVLYLYLTWCCLETITLSFHPVAAVLSSTDSDGNGVLSQSNEDSSSLHPSYDGHVIEEPFQLHGVRNNYINSDRIGGPPLDYGSTDAILNSQQKKANRNFLRYGRGHPKNFLRFGRAGTMQLGLGLVDDGTLDNEVHKRANDRNFLRYGRGGIKNFIRFGRASDRNFIRFGRSIRKQLKDCKDCKETDEQSQTSQNNESSSKLSKNKVEKRSKRSIPAFYDDLLFMEPTPLSWIENIGGYGPIPSDASDISGQVTTNGQKRAHSRSSFLRYGRDPLDLHFLRFGKRGSPSRLELEDGFPREARTSKNFLRYG